MGHRPFSILQEGHFSSQVKYIKQNTWGHQSYMKIPLDLNSEKSSLATPNDKPLILPCILSTPGGLGGLNMLN